MKYRLILLPVICIQFIFNIYSFSQNQEKKIRILTCGIRHESNTFSPYHAKESDFKVSRSIESLQDLPWMQFLQEKNDIETIPILHAYTWPNGTVEKATFDKFFKEIVAGAQNAGNVDGVYIDMHGALQVDGYMDAQVDFIQALRKIVGPDVLIAGSFDLHGNVSAEFVKNLNILTAYRTAPHVDGEETRKRAVQLLYQAIKNNQRPVIAQVVIPIIVPGEKAITASMPWKKLYGQLAEISRQEGLLDASIFIGYAWGDEARSAMTVHVVARDSTFLGKAQNEAKGLAMQIWDARGDMKYDVPALDIDEAIRLALRRPEKTIFISDSGDNTTAGCAGDNPLITERLMALGVKDAVVAGIIDPAAVTICERTGVGHKIALSIGGKIDYIFGKPMRIAGKVKNIALTKENEKMAILDVNGITIVLQSKHRSFISPEDFKEAGIDPLQHKIVVVKLGYLYPELAAIAPFAILALTPGFANQDLVKLPYKKIHRPIYPLDANMSWIPEIAK